MPSKKFFKPKAVLLLWINMAPKRVHRPREFTQRLTPRMAVWAPAEETGLQQVLVAIRDRPASEMGRALASQASVNGITLADVERKHAGLAAEVSRLEKQLPSMKGSTGFNQASTSLSRWREIESRLREILDHAKKR